MKYNFDSTTNRRGINSIKWDVEENELPMWVADMDFKALPEIKEAIIEAANKEGYGYSYPSEKLFKAYQTWWKKRHDIDIALNEMVYVSGVVSALDSLIRLLTKENDSVLLLSPCYNGFYSVVNNNKRKLVTSNLIHQDDDFIIDYQDVEDKIIKNKIQALIFCNPHNPVGKPWSKQEIRTIYDICQRHHVHFISDEIHADIIEPDAVFNSALSVADDVIVCTSPSKIFNLAGLQSAMVFIKDQNIRQKAQDAFYHDDIGEPNYFVEPATIAAYIYGEQYVDELNAYIAKNKEYVNDYLRNNLPHLKVVSGKATYLLWIDISHYQIPSDVFAEELRKETGLYISNGLAYGKNGLNFIRINVATSLANVKDAMNRLSAYLKGKE